MDKIKYIAEQFHLRGVEAYYVGGYVRDKLMGIESEDIDIVLVGVMDKNIVPFIVERVGIITEEHGNKFPNWTLVLDDGEVYDFALARKETKSGEDHTDFDVNWFGVTLEEDLQRRDLTINSIAENILTGNITDPFGGRYDIGKKLLHPTSDKFAEDPLRVLRAARIHAKFPEFEPTGKLIVKSIEVSDKINTISKERIGTELMKMFKTATKPSNFFKFLRGVNWLSLFPEIQDMIDVPQDPTHHPEGDVYTHTMLAMDSVDDWFIRATMLVHDIAKPLTTTIDGFPWTDNVVKDSFITFKGNHKIQALGHEDMGALMIEDFYGKYVYGDKKMRKQISMLVKLHMLRAKIPLSEKTLRGTIRELMSQGLDYYSLFRVIKADLDGRPPLSAPIELVYQLQMVRANELERDGSMNPIVTGDMLAVLGIKQGKEIGDIKAKALEIQDRGNLTKENWFDIIRGMQFPFFKDFKLNELPEEINGTNIPVEEAIENTSHLAKVEKSLVKLIHHNHTYLVNGEGKSVQIK